MRRGEGTQRQVAGITQPGYRFWTCGLHVATVYGGNDLIPDRPVNLFPFWVLRIEPIPFGLGDARLRLPPHCLAPEPHSEMQGVMPDIQALDELIPVPWLLEPVVLERSDELADNPFLHKFLVRLLSVIERRVIVHCWTCKDREHTS